MKYSCFTQAGDTIENFIQATDIVDIYFNTASVFGPVASKNYGCPTIIALYRHMPNRAKSHNEKRNLRII